MTEHQKKKMNKLAKEYTEKKWVVAQRAVCKDGYNAGYKAGLAEAQCLINSLEKIEAVEDIYSLGCECFEEAQQALKTFLEGNDEQR